MLELSVETQTILGKQLFGMILAERGAAGAAGNSAAATVADGPHGAPPGGRKQGVQRSSDDVELIIMNTGTGGVSGENRVSEKLLAAVLVYLDKSSPLLLEASDDQCFAAGGTSLIGQIASIAVATAAAEVASQASSTGLADRDASLLIGMLVNKVGQFSQFKSLILTCFQPSADVDVI